MFLRSFETIVITYLQYVTTNIVFNITHFSCHLTIFTISEQAELSLRYNFISLLISLQV